MQRSVGSVVRRLLANNKSVFFENALSFGSTPLVRLAKGSNIFGKIESRNPNGSIKDRAAFAMVSDAISSGYLKPGMEIVEPTSGNTGVALAAVGARRGFSVTVVMPESMSLERRILMKALGARVILTPKALGMAGSIAVAKEMQEKSPERVWIPNQFENPSNPKVHFETTGPEIFSSLPSIDIFVSGIGTGGTLSGCARYLKMRNPRIITVGVEPDESPIVSSFMKGEKCVPSPHGIQGIGAGFIPKNLDVSLVDKVVRITTSEALQCARELAEKEGILCGISSGAAACAALNVSKQPWAKHKTIVAILPDTGERYLSSALFEDLAKLAAAAKAGDNI